MTQQSISLWRGWQQLSCRAQLYGLALVVTLCYLGLGSINTMNQTWTQIHLPLSAASVLLLGIAFSEIYLYILRLRQREEELRLAHAREVELSERLALQRYTTINQISRALIDKLDCSQIAPEVIEQIAGLVDADAVVIWIADSPRAGAFQVRAAWGLQAHQPEELTQVRWSTPTFLTELPQPPRQMLHRELPLCGEVPLLRFCQNEQFVSVALSPIVRRNELIGVLGLFYRQQRDFAASEAAEMQTVANIIAGAFQAEELYRDLVQAQKIQSIGALTSGIAHDFNNVLAAILASANYVKQHTDPKSPAYRYLEATEASALRGAALTKQLLSFARREGPQRTVLDVNREIEETLKILERSFEKNILLQRHFAADLRPVEMDRSHLEQVVLNIAVNARDAMAGGGILTISTRNATLSADDPYRPEVNVPDGQYVVIGFRDTGIGMDEATQRRIFEPFFTTKQAGKGTGLGLAVVLSIVRNAGGDIRVESQPGKGAFFEVFLPASEKPLPAPPKTPPRIARGGRETILLVEDEDIIREMAQLELQAKGYRVITASDGVSALSAYRERWQEIDLVVADMVMPRISGPELLAKIKEINPHARVIVSSGYSHDLEGRRMLQYGCLAYLQKPYSGPTLCQTVREVLDSGL